jgi:hypothetical protein
MDQYNNSDEEKNYLLLYQNKCIDKIKNNKMKSINLTCSDNFTEIDKYKETIEALKMNTSIHTISITFNYTESSKQYKGYDEWCSILSDVLKINTTLLYMTLQIDNITNKSSTLLYEGLSMNTSIKEINIINNEVTINDNYKLLSDMLKTNSYILLVTLHFYNINIGSWINITDSLKVNNTLTQVAILLNHQGTYHQGKLFNGCTYLNEVILTNKTINYFHLVTYGMINYEEVIDAIEQNGSITYFSEGVCEETVDITFRLSKRRSINLHNLKLKSKQLTNL